MDSSERTLYLVAADQLRGISQGTTKLQSFHTQKNEGFQRLCNWLVQFMRQGATYNKIQYWRLAMQRQVRAPFLHDIHDCQKHCLQKLVRKKTLTPCSGPKPNCPAKHESLFVFFAFLRKWRLGIQALLSLFPCPHFHHLETSAIQQLTNVFPT